MGQLAVRFSLLLSLVALVGCPTEDWIKREDTYLSVERYKMMTEVIRVNDILYRVKKGEEINQNEITQLFIDLQVYKSSEKEEQKKQFDQLKARYKSNKSAFNTVLYALVLLEKNRNESQAHRVLSGLNYAAVPEDQTHLFDLAHILQRMLGHNKNISRSNAKLNNKILSIETDYDSIQERVVHLSKQVNALKSIEESINSREVGLDLNNR